MRTTILTLGLFVLCSGQPAQAQPAPAATSPPAAAEASARPTASVRGLRHRSTSTPSAPRTSAGH